MISFCNRRIRLSETYEKVCVHKTAVSSQSQKPRGKERKKERKKRRKNAKRRKRACFCSPPQIFSPRVPRLSCTCLHTTKSKSSPRAFINSSSVPITATRNHTTKHQHPHQEHRANNPERERRLPLLADAALLQPRERVEVQAVLRVVEDVGLAVAVDVALGPEELDCGCDDAGDVEDEQDEGAEHYDAGE